MNPSHFKYLLVLVVLTSVGCQTQKPVVKETFEPTKAKYVAPQTAGPVRGTGIEAQDVIGMTDQIMRDMLANPALTSRKTPPRIIIDASYLVNESTSRINTNMIADRLRVTLNRAANGRMIFVGRHFSSMVAKEREMKRSGTVDSGTIRRTKAQAGADFRLGGRITSQDTKGNNGISSKYHFITFEMVDLELGTIPYSGYYEFKKAGVEGSVKYR